MHKTPQLRYGDGYSLGQLAHSWQKPSVFMKSLASQGLLRTDERGVVANEELGRFYKESGTLLD